MSARDELIEKWVDENYGRGVCSFRVPVDPLEGQDRSGKRRQFARTGPTYPVPPACHYREGLIEATKLLRQEIEQMARFLGEVDE